MVPEVIIIGGGLAGSEAAWQVAKLGVQVRVVEMRPGKNTPAHHSGYLAELVCSNSLRAEGLENAVGVLKEEMRLLDSLIMACAGESRVPGGGALAVDRWEFASRVTRRLEEHPLISVIREEVTAIGGERPLIIATGPLTSPALSGALRELTGEGFLYFYDAASPIVTTESLDYDKVFRASRYGKGEAAYLNCPLSQAEYDRFYQALITAEVHPRHEFEKTLFFEGCLPVEEIAARGPETLRYGPLKPVGLVDPRTGKEPYAVVQLRQDDREERLYSLVGFQTSLRWGEQERVFRLIPGLEQAEFVRFGVMHRNTYINAPRLLLPTLELRGQPGIFLAGQITGVEGYVESTAMGLAAGVNAARLALGKEPVVFPPETATGALTHYICSASPDGFAPMNVNFGLFPPYHGKNRNRRKRRQEMGARSLETLKIFLGQGLVGTL